MKPNRYCHIRRLLHFTDSNSEPDMTYEYSGRLWKVRNLFEILNKTFSKFYSPSEHLAVDEVIVLFKLRAIFRNSYPRNTNVLASNFTKPVTILFTYLLTPWSRVLLEKLASL